MALNIQSLKREFIYTKNGKELRLSDPARSMSPEQVMMFYANTYPELTTSTVHGPKINGDSVEYSFKTTIGTKG